MARRRLLSAILVLTWLRDTRARDLRTRNARWPSRKASGIAAALRCPEAARAGHGWVGRCDVREGLFRPSGWLFGGGGAW
jgi:hypothetical protein